MSQYASNLSLLLDDNVAALVIQTELRPISGNVIFPPTYAGTKKGDSSRYNLNATRHGKRVVVDSIPSQANRIEPLFMQAPYRQLVPQLEVTAGVKTANLLEMGHRLADAAIRFTALDTEIAAAFQAYQQGNAVPLAKLGPTSLVFGAWDSRASRAKIPRLLNAEIIATDVEDLTRLSQYMPTFEYVDMGLSEKDAEKEKDDKKASELGIAHVPNEGLGGVVVHGAIQRTAVLNLTGLRALHGMDDEQTHLLRQYTLGLALLATHAPMDYNLRQGCQLVTDSAHPMVSKLVLQNGTEVSITFEWEKILAFATQTASAFGVGENRQVQFETNLLKATRKKSGAGNKDDG